MSPRSKSVWLFSAGLISVLVAFYWPFLTNDRNYYQSDLTYYFEPFTRFIADALRQGRLPLWNPYLYCGMSQVAVPSPGIFYPFTLLFVLLPFSRALALYLAIHQYIAGIGAFLIADALGFGIPGAVVAGAGFALCGYMFAFQANYTLVATVAWLPLLVFCLHHVDETLAMRNVVRMFAASLVMALMVGAGRPELSVPAALLAVAFIVCTGYDAWRMTGDWQRPAKQFALKLCSMTAGGLIAMPVILPAMEWARVSPRARGLELKWVLMWSANWYDCLCMLCAQPVGDLTELGNKYLNMVAARANAIPFLQSTYISPAIFTLALWSFFDRRWRFNLCVVAVLVCSLIMALGNNTVVAPSICSLSPVLAGFRYPVKLIIFPIIALLLLAARGAGAAGELRIGRPAVWCATGLWIICFLVGLTFTVAPQLAKWYCVSQHFGLSHLTEMKNAQILFGESLITAACLGMATVATYVAYKQWRFGESFFAVAMSIAVMAMLMWPAFRYLRHGSIPDFYSRPVELASWSKQYLAAGVHDNGENIAHRALTLYFDPLTPSDSFLEDQDLPFQDGFYFYARSLLLPNNNVEFGIPYAFGYEAAEVGKFKTWFSNALGKCSQNRAKARGESDLPMARFCALTNVNLVLTQVYQHKPNNLVAKLDPKYFTLLESDEDTNVRKYTVKQQLPRAYYAARIARSSWDEFLKKMLDTEDGVVIRPTFVDKDFPESLLHKQTGVAAESTLRDQSIDFETDTADNVVLTTSCLNEGLFVLSDQYYPGWTARVDGRPAPIYRVNYFARGLWLTPGKHRIEFSYWPNSLSYGVWILASVFAAYLILLILSMVKKTPESVIVVTSEKKMFVEERRS